MRNHSPLPAEQRRRRFLTWTGLSVVASLAGPLLQACANAAVVRPRPAADANALLLAPEDFPEGNIRILQRFEQREMADGGLTSQIILTDGEGQIVQSVVIFASEAPAQAALADLRQGGAGSLWQPQSTAPSFGQESAVFVGKQGGQDAVLAIFRRRQVMMKLTYVGSRQLAKLTPYIQQAEGKLGQPRR